MMFRNLLFFLALTMFASIFFYSCANQGPAPSGGPKDSIPPTVIQSVPLNQSLNYKGNELYFEFDERIKADQLKQRLIITPNSDIKYSFVAKKNRLIIKIQTELEDSTTYSFNFLDGVTDITENNPVFNFKLAYSTGPYIDSIYINGTVKELFEGEPVAGTLIGLYDVLDTADVFNRKPKYFINTSEDGTFSIENIKTGKYKVFAWRDKNKNLTLESEQEAFGFLKDTLDLYNNADSLKIFTLNLDTRSPKVTSARALGRYYNVKYNKQLLSYEILNADSTLPQPANHLINKEKLIRFYNSVELPEGDSITYYIKSQDSLFQTSIDTVQVKFTPSKKDPEPFTIAFLNPDRTIKDTISMSMQFSKPVISDLLKDSIQIAIDTLSYLPIDSLSSFTWNNTKTKLDFKTTISWQAINDSIRSLNAYFKLQDSLETDSLKKGKYIKLQGDQLFLHFKKGSLVSVEQDTLDTQTARFTKEDSEAFAKIFLNINTQYQRFWIEMLEADSKEIIRTIPVTNERNITISRIPPGKYKFRCKIDENNDGVWSIGNIHQNVEPEPIIQTDLETTTKANWEQTLDLTF